MSVGAEGVGLLDKSEPTMPTDGGANAATAASVFDPLLAELGDMIPEHETASRANWRCYACDPLVRSRPTAACYSPTCRAIRSWLTTDLSARVRFYLAVLELKKVLGVAKHGPEELFECAVQRGVPETLWGEFVARALEHGLPELDTA